MSGTKPGIQPAAVSKRTRTVEIRARGCRPVRSGGRTGRQTERDEGCGGSIATWCSAGVVPQRGRAPEVSQISYNIMLGGPSYFVHANTPISLSD